MAAVYCHWPTPPVSKPRCVRRCKSLAAALREEAECMGPCPGATKQRHAAVNRRPQDFFFFVIICLATLHVDGHIYGLDIIIVTTVQYFTLHANTGEEQRWDIRPSPACFSCGFSLGPWDGPSWCRTYSSVQVYSCIILWSTSAAHGEEAKFALRAVSRGREA